MKINFLTKKEPLFIIIMFTLVAHFVQAQEESTGFIIKSLKINDVEYFDFFVSTKIDTTKTIEDNLLQIKNDTLKRISISNDYTAYAINNTNVPIKVIPVIVTWSPWSVQDLFINQRHYVRYDIKLGNHHIISGYNPNRIYAFKEIKSLNLRTSTNEK